MHRRRRLLGSTALVGAGVLLAGAVPAVLLAGAAPAERVRSMQVKLSGFTEFEVLGATKDTLSGGRNRNYTFQMMNEVHIETVATTNSGIIYGSYLEIAVGSNGSRNQNANAFVDEVNLFFTGDFGRVSLGQQDGAEDVMFVGAEDAQSGTGGIDGDTRNLAMVISVQNTGDATKATYFTPRVAGFQLGASFTPDTGDNLGIKNDANIDNSLGVGSNWIGTFGAARLVLSAVGIVGNGESRGFSNRSFGNVADYSVGGLLGFGGLSFGATWGQLTDGLAFTKDNNFPESLQGLVHQPRSSVHARTRERQPRLLAQLARRPRQSERLRGQWRLRFVAGGDAQGGRFLQHQRSGRGQFRPDQLEADVVGRSGNPDQLLRSSPSLRATRWSAVQRQNRRAGSGESRQLCVRLPTPLPKPPLP